MPFLSASTSTTPRGPRGKGPAWDTPPSAVQQRHPPPQRTAWQTRVRRAARQASRRRAERGSAEGVRATHAARETWKWVGGAVGVPPRPVQHRGELIQAVRGLSRSSAWRSLGGSGEGEGGMWVWVGGWGGGVGEGASVVGRKFSMGQGRVVNVGLPPRSRGSTMISGSADANRLSAQCRGLGRVEGAEARNPTAPPAATLLALGRTGWVGRRGEGGGGGERGEWSKVHAAPPPCCSFEKRPRDVIHSRLAQPVAVRRAVAGQGFFFLLAWRPPDGPYDPPPPPRGLRVEAGWPAGLAKCAPPPHRTSCGDAAVSRPPHTGGGGRGAASHPAATGT